jgi:hypothetical protein
LLTTLQRLTQADGTRKHDAHVRPRILATTRAETLMVNLDVRVLRKLAELVETK